MDNIVNPPVIASAPNLNYFDFSGLLPCDFSVPSDPPLSETSSFNTSNNDGDTDSRACSTGMQPTQTSNSLACATRLSAPLPVWGMPATSATSSIIPTSPLKPQTDENRPIAPLPLRSAAPTSSTGLKPQEDQTPGTVPLPFCSTASISPVDPSTGALQPQAHLNMSLSPLPTTNILGKKRKSIPVDETVTPSEPKKHRPLSEKQKQKQKAVEIASDNRVPSESIHSRLNSQPNEPRDIQHLPTVVVKDAQHLQSLVSTCGLPGILQVGINEQYPTRILHMMVYVQDPESQRILSAYFVPYLWFPEEPKRPYRLRKDDKYFWGHRIYEYQHRVQCGRIAFTITGSPVLFFNSEEKKLIDSINYHMLLNFHRRKAGNNTQAQVMQSLPSTVAQGFGATPLVVPSKVTPSSQVDALPTEESLTAQNNGSDDTSTLTETACDQLYQQSFDPSTSVVNPFVDSRLSNNNNSADSNTSTSFDFTYNIPSMVQPGTSTDVSQSFPALSDLASDTFQGFQINNNDDNNSASNINVDTSSPFTFNINDLPTIEEPPSTDISGQSCSEPNNLASDTLANYQINNNDNGTSNVDTGAPSDFTFDINDLPVISNEIHQPFSDLTPNPSLDMQFNNGASTINPDASSDLTFNTNDLPIIEQAPSNEISPSFSESETLGPTPSHDVVQFYNEFDPSSSAFFGLFDSNYSADGTTTGTTTGPGPSNDTTQSVSEMENMYMNFDWLASQEAQPPT